jgi:putative endonuclease
LSKNDSHSRQNWYLYLIRTVTGHLYTGVTTDPQRRLLEHQQGGRRAARSLRGKGPLTMVFTAQCADRSAALKQEYRVKQLSRAEKEVLIDQTAEDKTRKAIDKLDY